MSNRTVIVLVVIAAALFAFIYFYDRDRMTTGELEGRKDRVFVEFKSDLVDGLEIQGGSGQKVVLVRAAKAAAEGAEDEWRIEAPRALAADGAAVREILSALDFLVKKRVVLGPGERDKPQYGLEAPAVSAAFTIGGVRTAFRIGTGKGSGETVYVAVDGRPDELYAVEADFRSSLDKELDDLRDKHLVEGSLDDAIAIEVARAAGPLALARPAKGEAWRLSRGGVEMLAAEDQAASLLADVAGLRAEEFVADGAAGADLGKYGLDAPTHRISIRREGGKELELLLGKACPGDGRVYAAIRGSGTVACVADDIATAADRPAARFAETRPLVFGEDEIEKIVVARGGASITLERDAEQGWLAAGHKGVAIEADAVLAVLRALRETRAEEVLPGAEAVAALGGPAASVELVREAGGGSLKIDVFAADPEAAADAPASAGRQRARRGGEEGVLVFATDLLAELRADLLAYRERRIESGSPEDVVALEIEGPAAQRLALENSLWRLEAPLESRADMTAARDAARLVADVEVVRFAAGRAEPAHGLAAPYVRATVRFADKTKGGADAGASGKRATLEIGAPAGTDGSRFARIAGGDGLVFVLKKEQVDLLAVPLVARDLLEVDAGDLAKVAITAAGGALVAERAGEEWKAAGASVDAAQLGRLIGELGAIRAIRGAAFGPAVGFEAPALKVELWTREQLDKKEAPAVLLFGAKTADAGEDGYTARKQGVDVTVIVPARLVDDLIALVPPPPPAS